jgi:transcriptional regulator with XRE-family HTH domain
MAGSAGMPGSSIKIYLATVGMTMTDFAKSLDCAMPYLSSIANGRAKPSKRLARDIYKATGGVVDIDIPETVSKKKTANQTANMD